MFSSREELIIAIIVNIDLEDSRKVYNILSSLLNKIDIYTLYNKL